MKKILAVLFFVAFVLSAVIDISFTHYRKSLDEEFNLLILDNLQAYTQSQKNEVLARIQEVNATLEALALMINSQGVDPDAEWLLRYLDNLSEFQPNYDISYISFSSYLAMAGTGDMYDMQMIDRLQRHEPVISDVRFSERLDNKYYFSVAVPIEKDGKVIGVLRSLLEAPLLVQTSQGGFLRESINSHIIKGDGEFIPLNTSDTGNEMLFSDLDFRIPQSMILDMQTDFASQGSGGYMVPYGRDLFFMSFSSLGYNDWYIFNYTRSRDLSSHSQRIMKNTIWITTEFILLVVVAACIVFWYLRRQWHELFVAQTRYSMLSHFSDTVLFEYSIKDDELVFTDNVREMLPMDKPHISHVSKLDQKASILAPESQNLVLAVIRNVADINETQSQELEFSFDDERQLWCECIYQVIRDDRNLPVLIVGKLVDMSNRKRQMEELIEKARRDKLTGLYNKDAEEKLVKIALTSDESGYMLMIDVDDFKKLNDQYGHLIGDSVLRRFGRVLRDIFSDCGALPCRTGGDEFLVYVPMSNREMLTEKVEHILSAATDFCMDTEHTIHISTSIGIAAYPTDGISYDLLYVAADKAMYEAKRAGKNTYRFYDSSRD